MPTSQLSVIVGGFTELAQALSASKRFKQVFDVPDTATLAQEASARVYPPKSELCLVLADSMPSTSISLEFILSRLVASGYAVVMVNVSGTAHDWARKFPGIGTLKGGTTVNSVLAAISGRTGRMLDPVEGGHTPIYPGQSVPPINPQPEPVTTPTPPKRKPTPPPVRRAPDAYSVSGDPQPSHDTLGPAVREEFPAAPAAPALPEDAAPAGGGFADDWKTADDWQPATPATPTPTPATPVTAPPPPEPIPVITPSQPTGWTDTPESIATPPAVRAPVARPGMSRVAAPRRAKVIPVAAAKGGTGKSSVSLNIAAFLGLRTNQQVAIIDLNIQQADVGKYIKQYSAKTVVDLVSNLPSITPENIRDYMAYSKEGNFYAVLGPHNPNYADPGILNSNVYRTILEYLRQTFDYIIIDTPVAEKYHDLVSNFAVREADHVIFVVAPNWTTIHNARLYLKMLTKEPDGPRLPLDKVGWILNQYRGDVDCDEDQAREAMAEYHYLGHLPYTPEWQRANNNFELIVTQRYDDINAAFARMLSEVTGIDFPVRQIGGGGGKKSSLWDRLRGK